MAHQHHLLNHNDLSMPHDQRHSSPVQLLRHTNPLTHILRHMSLGKVQSRAMLVGRQGIAINCRPPPTGLQHPLASLPLRVRALSRARQPVRRFTRHHQWCTSAQCLSTHLERRNRRPLRRRLARTLATMTVTGSRYRSRLRTTTNPMLASHLQVSRRMVRQERRHFISLQCPRSPKRTLIATCAHNAQRLSAGPQACASTCTVIQARSLSSALTPAAARLSAFAVT